MFTSRFPRSTRAQLKAASAAAVCLVFAAMIPGNSAEAGEAEGAKVIFRTSVAGEARSAAAELRSINDVAYVAIDTVLQQFGGGTNVFPGRVQLDFLGRSAWVRLEGKSVNASLTQFQLRHDLLRREAGILMALSDVAPFFREAFGVDVSQELAAAERPVQRTIQPEAVVMRDLVLPDPPAPVEPKEIPLADLEEPSTQAHRSALRTIVIDAGHGGMDHGIQSSAIAEKDVTLAVARHLARILENSAYDGRVIMTRTQDTNPSLEARARLANAQNADVLISIHAGASMTPSAKGFELFVPPDERLRAALGGARGDRAGAQRYAAQSAAIAEALASALVQTAEITNRGIRTAPSRIFREVDMPCVVIEVGSLTNSAEAARLAEEDYQAQIAQGLADGLLAYEGAARSAGARP